MGSKKQTSQENKEEPQNTALEKRLEELKEAHAALERQKHK